MSGSTVRGVVRGAPAEDMLLAVVSNYSCIAKVEADGSFLLTTVPGPQVITGGGVSVCVFPAWVDVPRSGQVSIMLQAVPTKSPLDDSFLVLPGGSYVPATYEDRQCRASQQYIRENRNIASLADLPRLPPPDSVVALILRSDTLSALLGTDSPVRFRYWNEPTATRAGIVDGKQYAIGDGPGFVIVESSTPSAVELRIGSLDRYPLSSELWRVKLPSGSLEFLERSTMQGRNP